MWVRRVRVVAALSLSLSLPLPLPPLSVCCEREIVMCVCVPVAPRRSLTVFRRLRGQDGHQSVGFVRSVSSVHFPRVARLPLLRLRRVCRRGLRRRQRVARLRFAAVAPLQPPLPQGQQVGLGLGLGLGVCSVCMCMCLCVCMSVCTCVCVLMCMYECVRGGLLCV